LIWLQNIFEKHTAYRTKGNYHLLILNSHGSYGTPKFDLFAKEHQIVIICMLSHLLYLLQPLDVNCFTVLKQLYGQQIQELMCTNINHIDKSDFLKAYYYTRKAIMSLANITSSFAATGVVPYDPDRVLAMLNVQIQTLTSSIIPEPER
jgi:hypothetical protein